MQAIDEAGYLATITPIFQDIFQDDHLTLDEHSRREDLPQWDSMNHLNIIMALEIQYRIKFSLMEIEDIRGIGDLIAMIRQKSGG